MRNVRENITRAHGGRTKKEGVEDINDSLFIREMRFVHKSREPAANHVAPPFVAVWKGLGYRID